MMHRLQFDATEETLKEIDELRHATRFANRAELFRNAIRFLQWAIHEMQQGGELQIVKKGAEPQRIVFPFLITIGTEEAKPSPVPQPAAAD